MRCRRGAGRGGFFFQAEDGIRDVAVTGVQTCALPISFSRSFSLANSVKSEAIKADYQNGVLTLSIPKREEAKPKQIKVNVTTNLMGAHAMRSEERRVGKECRSRWSPYH